MDEQKLPHKGHGHRQRLRERFLASGLDGFHDYEVIELLLTLGTPRKDCKDAAKRVMEKFRTLPEVFEASSDALCEIKGLGPRNILGIRLIKAVADRYLAQRLIRKNPVNNSKELFEYLFYNMKNRGRECFMAIFLDAKNRIITTKVLFEGTLTASSVYPREVVQAAIEHHAAAIIFAHNHPSGDPGPSPEDVAVTKKLVFACQVVGITVHEHLVIGDNKYFSFADKGYIAEMTREFDARGTVMEKRSRDD